MTDANMIDISSGAPSSGGKKRAIIAAAIAGVVLLATVGGLFGKQLYASYQHRKEVASVLDVDTFYKGIAVAGVDLGGKTMEQAKTAVTAAEPGLRGKYDIRLVYQNKTWQLTEDDLNFQFNTDEVLKEAYAYARTGDREERYQQVLALQTSPKTYNVTNTMNYDNLDAKLKETVKDIAYDPVDATVASFDTKTATFRYADGKNGLAVDENKLYTQVEALINGPKTGTVQVPTTVVPFSKTIAEVKSHLQKLGTYSTTSTNNANGTHNMALALSRINGTSIPAGGTFSFNAIVGDSTSKSSGFLEAGAILNGRLIQSYGGGICQASTTVYGAALRSNMKITQRSNHTLQSTYCPIGQDAAVSYPELDFKFQNPTDYPVYIISGIKGKVLTVTFYGYQSPDYDQIVVTSKKTETIPAPTTPKYIVDKTLAKGVVKLDSKARTGARATAQRIYYKNGAVVKTENLPSSYYRAQPAYYSIGPGTTVNGIPSSSASSQPSSSSKPPASSSKPASSSSAPASGSPSSSSSSTGQSSGVDSGDTDSDAVPADTIIPE
ncbi:VanW family protein [Caproiciproducens faecalis]|uniref:VanW family protein n=1 Tax=Caproiciproducens faecalis TaxID=2820301 RepID=A0ABS7DPH6_9FIRM|nr:VanW family protein [Caproiciproducens faecalis]MBW7573098.1 VanW family protein [Caproiciproducens faecalis]